MDENGEILHASKNKAGPFILPFYMTLHGPLQTIVVHGLWLKAGIIHRPLMKRIIDIHFKLNSLTKRSRWIFS